MTRCAVMAAMTVTVAMVVMTARLAAPPRLPSPPPAIAFWEWSGRTQLDRATMVGLDTLGCRELYAWCGSLQKIDDQLVFRDLGAVPDLPDTMALHLVLRCEGSAIAEIGGNIEALAAAVANAALTRASGHRVVGLQLDGDVPVRRLAAYGALLRAVRPRLPATWRLTSTMLLSWRHSLDLAVVAAAVDELLPQCYSTVPVSRDGSLIGGGDMAATVAALEALQVDYRIGLPCFEQTAVLRQGRVLASAVPLSLATLLRTGLPLVAVHEPWGRGFSLTCRQDYALGVVDLRSGDVVRTAMSTAAGLAERIGELRGCAGPHCRGIALFRLPGPEVTRTLSLAQIGAAIANAVRSADVVLRQDSDADGWRITVVNPGDDDWCSLDRPARVHVTGCTGPHSDGGELVYTRGGEPCSALHADGVMVTLRFLPAGGSVMIAGRGPLPRVRLDH